MHLDYDPTLTPRLAIYSQDGLGLGHMRRTSSIAHQFLETLPGAGILTLSDSQLGQFFKTLPNHDYLKLPSIVKDGPGIWRAANLPLSFDSIHCMRSELICSALLSFMPDILLVDHMPHGAMGELMPALSSLKAIGAGTKVVLGLRDILDSPEVIQQRWKVEGAFDVLQEFYDQILIYGMRDIFDLVDQYRFPENIAEKVHYCGYVCTPDLPRYGSRARMQSLSKAQKGSRLIVAMAGGGADAYPVMSALLDAFPAIHADHPSVLVLITGPFMPADQRHDLETRSRGLPVKVRESVSDPLSYMEAADLIVAMAGYNTTIEILRSGKPAILIPRLGPSAEQRTRARLFADRGWIEMIDPAELTPDRLASQVIANMTRGVEPAAISRPDLNGVIAATGNLVELLPHQVDPEEINMDMAEEYFNGLSL